MPGPSGPEPPVPLPAGRVVFRVWRTGDGRAVAEPVVAWDVAGPAAVAPDDAQRWPAFARAFADAYYARGATLVLYREGVRVGTFRVAAVTPDSVGSCPALRAAGRVELDPAAVPIPEFLAVREGTGPDTAGYRVPDLRPEARELAAVLAERALAGRADAQGWRPREPDDLRPLRWAEGQIGFAATFLRDDTLAVAPPGPRGAALFLVAGYDRATGYRPIHVEWEPYAAGDKRAVRWVDRFDLDADGALEWVLLAHGAVTRWYEVYDGSGGRWTRRWSGRSPLCEVSVAR